MSATAETGFANPKGARAIARRMILRRQLLQVRASSAALLDLLDQRAKAHCDAAAAAGQSGISLAAGDQEGCVRRLPIHCVESDDMREQQLLEGVDLVLDLLDRLQVGLGHGLFSIEAMAEPIEPTDPAHRLSGGAK